MKFPDGFYWGASSASYQVEGGIENTDWAEEARNERVPVCGKACDHYHLYEEDFDIAASLGHNAHRFSVEWARIEPEEGKFDKEAIEHYRKVLKALKTRNIKPFITLWHFTLPLWFYESGGFERKDAPEIFARYCAYVVEQLGDLCQNFATMNEPHVFVSNGYRRGTWPPFLKWPGIDRVGIVESYPGYDPRPVTKYSNLLRYWWVFHRIAWSHNRAYREIKKVSPKTEVGVVRHVLLFRSNWNPFNIFRAWLANLHWTHYWFWITRNTFDDIGLNYYIQKKFGDTETYEKTDMGWDEYPEGIYNVLIFLKRYKKPVFVAEAGVADEDDSNRAAYITRQVEGVWEAMQNGVDVRGHMYWSLLDNYEWALGFNKRFGLVEIDYSNLERRVRPSAYVYKKIIEDNGIV